MDKLELKSCHEVIYTVDVADVDSIFHGKPIDPNILTVVMKDGKRLYCDEVCPIDSMQEEPKKCMYALDDFNDEDRKVTCDGCEEECELRQKPEWSKEVREEFERKYNEGKSVGMELAKIELSKPVVWSEKDDWRFTRIIRAIKSSTDCNCEDEDWLKSLRDRYTWKPSDEQMNALHDAAVYVDKSMFPYPKGILMKLYKQLKKLREE
jgi:hypothetical protein